MYLLLISGVFILPYFINPWWKFILATVGIILLSIKWQTDNWKNKLGLCITKKTFLQAASLFIVCFLSFKLFFSYQMLHFGIQIRNFSYVWCLALIFQVLNEEMVLRGLLLGYLKKILSHEIGLASIAALVFSLLHVFFYYVAEHFTISYLSLLSLFLFSFSCNVLFLRFHHIWFGYAIHLAWNVNRFTGGFFFHDKLLSEAHSFNIFEGSSFVVIFLLVLVLASMLITLIAKHFKG